MSWQEIGKMVKGSEVTSPYDKCGRIQIGQLSF